MKGAGLSLLLTLGLTFALPCAAKPLAEESHRISVQVLEPDSAPVNTWQVRVLGTYRPLVEGSPNTTVTTTSRSNCTQSRYNLLPSFERCTRTYNRSVSRAVPAAQIVATGPHSLDLDFAPVIDDQGGVFGIEGLTLEYMPCAKGCDSQRVDIELSCYADEVEPGEILSNGLILRYARGAKTARKVAECGLERGEEIFWANRATVLARVRGHFGDEQQMVSHELLDRFAAIPAAEHGWLWNPAKARDDLDEHCPKTEEQSYTNTTYHVTLPVGTGWPYTHEAEVYVTGRVNGQACTVWLTGTGDESYLRYFYSFENGQLVKVHTSGEPHDVSRQWRWVNGEPWEYTRRQMPDSVAGHDAILYWHKTAAEQWPKKMDYKPDLAEFNALNTFAQELFKRFPLQNTAP